MMFSPEWISAASAVLALIIVAVSVHAALRQLELIRLSNQTATFLSLVQLTQTEGFRKSLSLIYDGRLDTLCDQLGEASTAEQIWQKGTDALPALFLYESIGACVMYKMMDAKIAFGTFNPAGVWRRSERFVRLYRKISGRDQVLDKLEALAALAQIHREPEWPRMPDKTIAER